MRYFSLKKAGDVVEGMSLSCVRNEIVWVVTGGVFIERIVAGLDMRE